VQPRAATCPAPLAFDVSSGFCIRYKRVKGCEKFYNHLKIKEEVLETATQQLPLEEPISGKSAQNFFNFGRKY
jgi:hypothetical protein